MHLILLLCSEICKNIKGSFVADEWTFQFFKTNMQLYTNSEIKYLRDFHESSTQIKVSSYES